MKDNIIYGIMVLVFGLTVISSGIAAKDIDIIALSFVFVLGVGIVNIVKQLEYIVDQLFALNLKP